MAPRVVCCPPQRATRPSRASVTAATTKVTRAQVCSWESTSTTRSGARPRRRIVSWFATVNTGWGIGKTGSPDVGDPECTAAGDVAPDTGGSSELLQAILLRDQGLHQQLAGLLLGVADRAVLVVARAHGEPGAPAPARAPDL